MEDVRRFVFSGKMTRRRLFGSVIRLAFILISNIYFLFRWATRTKPYMISAIGPSPNGQPVDFGLKSPPNFRLWPFHVRVTKRQLGEIYIRYEYLPPLDKHTRVHLSLYLKDKDHHVYYTVDGDCPNAFLDIPDIRQHYPNSRFMTINESGMQFDIPLNELERLHEIQCVFKV